MAFSQLDPHTALIVIDLQYGIVALPTCDDAAAVVDKSAKIIGAFRQQQRPVVLVNVAGGAPGRTAQAPSDGQRPDNWATLVPELGTDSHDIHVTKNNWGAFINTDLHQQLQARGVTQVVIIGIATSIGVESTARQAFELGYNVSLVSDAMTDLHRDTHENSLQRIFPRLGETGTTEELLALVAE
ncbi:isochorismatase family protein [Shewanella yunxiaonensis]|uniref:Isochorismatase family protein n=1 Tax=Shewanella yunxiaonensis TaxID=2829809 RepID=A0ABX7YRX9_9GAMM|nr:MULTISPECIES: isochorismatase family protein [Shewanella]MDF0534179.1 isochorismatase family protein [Shewanella sp. A32]QUN05518.1 isochorismatase family protein [Shewanella yunxiaonensis]